MKKDSFKFYDITTRYLISLISAFSNFYIFYLIFTPLTIYPVFFILNLFYPVSLSSNNIILETFSVEIINACVAGSAYYLLFILNLITPNIKVKKRILMISLSFLTLLTLNILRIVFLSSLFFNESSFFDITHKIFWYGLSTIFIVLIWFGEVYLFKIKDIPAYSDIKFLLKLTKRK